MGKPQKKPKLTDAERQERFAEMAKKVEASENLEDFDRAFAKIGRPRAATLRPKPDSNPSRD